MGRIGKLAIQIPDGVKAMLKDNKIRVEGPKGEIEQLIPEEVQVKIENKEIKVTPKEETKIHESLRGTMRAIINNMVIGATHGYEKALIMEGREYRASFDNKELNLQLGYANPIKFRAPEGIKIEVPSPQRIIIHGIDKQVVSNIAATIRALKPPEPYKGKGIRYEGEVVRRKAGKKAGYGATGA